MYNIVKFILIYYILLQWSFIIYNFLKFPSTKFNMVYTVVHFENDDTVEAVPNYWFRKNKCAWPIKWNIQRCIEKKTKPNNVEFIFLKARKLCGEIGKFILLFVNLLSINNLH